MICLSVLHMFLGYSYVESIGEEDEDHNSCDYRYDSPDLERVYLFHWVLTLLSNRLMSDWRTRHIRASEGLVMFFSRGAGGDEVRSTRTKLIRKGTMQPSLLPFPKKINS